MEVSLTNDEQIGVVDNIAKQYFFELFGTFQFYEDDFGGSEGGGGGINAQNCGQMAQRINQEMLQNNISSRLSAMYRSEKQGKGKEPYHIITCVDIEGDVFIVDPTLLLNKSVKLPKQIGVFRDYSSGDIIGQDNYINRYHKISKHVYRWEKIKEGAVVKTGLFDDRPIGGDQIKMIIGKQESLRSDLKLGRMNQLFDGSINYSKLKFDPKNEGYLTYYKGRDQKKIDIKDLLQGVYDDELIDNLGLTRDGIKQIPNAVSNFIFYKNYMSTINEEIKKLEQNTQRGDIDLNIIEPKNPDSKIYCYLHGLYSDKDSSKAKVIGIEGAKIGDGNIRFSFRGNGDSVSDHFQFSDMNMETMAEDFIKIAQESNNLYPQNKIVPVASSLGASALLYAIKLYPELIDQCEKIILLSPSIEFAKNRRRLRQIKNDIKSEKKWKSQGYLIEHHSTGEQDSRINYQLFEQSLNEDLIQTLSELQIPITIVVGRNDPVIEYQTIDSIAATNPYIDLIVVHDSHSLKQKMDLIIKSL